MRSIVRWTRSGIPVIDYGQPYEGWIPPTWLLEGNAIITGLSYPIEQAEQDKAWFKIWKKREKALWKQIKRVRRRDKRPYAVSDWLRENGYRK